MASSDKIVKVKQIWMTHESGTKFYQVFELTPSGGKSVTVTHWGAINRMRGSTRPVNGGETQVKVGTLLNATVAAKLKRGYSGTINYDMKYFTDAPYWKEQFGATLAHEIQMAMYAEVLASESGPEDEDDTYINPEAVALPSDRPDSWGSW